MTRAETAHGRPWVDVMMAMSADGKIADAGRSPQRIASPRDRAVLDERMSSADAVLYGAGTLRALRRGIQLSPAWSAEQIRPLTNIVASTRAEFDMDMPFFDEPASRWLVCATKPTSAVTKCFDEVLVCPNDAGDSVSWPTAMRELNRLGIERICCGGGGDLAGALASERLVDEYWITIAPLFIGGRSAPTPLDGEDLALGKMPELTLVSSEVVDGEVFLRYRAVRASDPSP